MYDETSASKPRDLLPFPTLTAVSPGLDIHFIHVKPPQQPRGCTPKPLLMVHGWPGSFYEFYKIIPFLTEPKNHGLNDKHVFEVICPSIPGYGFSEASSKKGKGPPQRLGQLLSEPGGLWKEVPGTPEHLCYAKGRGPSQGAVPTVGTRAFDSCSQASLLGSPISRHCTV